MSETCSHAFCIRTAAIRFDQRAGADPAFGSGPLATVLQDILTIGIYFAVAAPVAA